MTESSLIVGLGNAQRGDDGAGLAVARALKQALAEIEAPSVRVELCEDPSSLPLMWKDHAHATVIDAVKSAATPGSLLHIDVLGTSLPEAAALTSSHGFGLREALELSKALGTLPKQVELLGIVGNDFTIGAPLSPAVSHAVNRVVTELMGQLAKRETSAIS